MAGKKTDKARQISGGDVEAKRPRKLIAFDPDTLQALELLSRDAMKGLQDLADEAFRDLLKKHQRPSSLKDALRQSTRALPANDAPAKRTRRVR